MLLLSKFFLLRALFFILLSLSGIFASSQSTNSVYLCLGNDDIVLADLDNCSSSLITTLPESLFDISQGDTDDTLYGIKDERLYRINVSNGSFTLLGDLTIVGFNGNFRVTSLVKEADGLLLGANQSSNGELFRIGVNTMTATNLGATGFESAGDLTFLNGVLYLSGDNNELIEVDINNPSQSILIGSMSLNGGQSIFGVVSIITANPCASNPTVDLIATGGRSTGIVDPSNGNTTTTCTNLVGSNIFGAAEVTSDIICSIDLEILGDGLQNPEYCGTANPNLTSTVDPVSPIGTYAYEWREQGSSTVLSTNPDYSPTVTTTTTYECTVTDSGRAAPDNIAVDTITVTINDEPVYNSLGNVIVHSFYDLPSINGTNIPANASYFTQPNGNGTQLNVGRQVQETDFSSNPVTLYVFGTDANSCDLTGQFTLEFATAQVVIDSRPASGSIEVCNGDQITITARPIPFDAYGNYTYNWDDGIGTSLADTASITVTPTQDTTFSVTINDSGIINGNGMGGDMIPVDVSFLDVDDVPDELAANGSFTFPPITGTDLTTPAPRYSLTPGAVGPFFDPGDTVTAADFTSLPARIYIYDNDGVCVDEEDFLLDFIQDLTVSITPSRAESCAGENVTYEALPSPRMSLGSYSYEWRVLGTTAVIGTLQTLDYATNATLELECTVIDSGISGASGTAVATVEVEVIPQPRVDDLPSITVINSFPFPTITGTNLTGNQAFYTEPNGAGPPFLPGVVVDVTSFSSFPVTIYVYDSNNGCDDQEQFELIIEPIALTLSLTADSTTICEGDTVMITASPDPPNAINQYEYEWLVDNVPDPQVGAVATFAPQQANSIISCVVRDSGIVGAPQMYSEDISITVLPNIQITNPGDRSVNNSFTFPAITGPNVTANAIYSTQSGGAGQPFQPGDVVTRADFTSLPVQIFIYDTNGTCDAEVSFTLDIVEPQPTVTVTATETDICNGEEITLTATADPLTAIGDYSYEWTVVGDTTVIGADRNLAVIPETSTIYQCTVTDSGIATPNNQASDTIAINVSDSPSLDEVEDIVIQDQFVFADILGTSLSGNEAYFTNTGGQGTRYLPGDVLEYNESSTYPLTIFIYDESAAGCSDEVEFQITILEPQPELFYIPQVVTPNQDNYHDTWNVEILNSEVNIEYVFIYDRYGKLITQVVPGGIGWDGTLNNNPLPSSSYWYQFIYTYRGAELEEKGYFALKR